MTATPKKPRAKTWADVPAKVRLDVLHGIAVSSQDAIWDQGRAFKQGDMLAHAHWTAIVDAYRLAIKELRALARQGRGKGKGR